jgi:hypothetical protein
MLDYLTKIAPFAIVTNGSETEIFDVINNKRLTDDDLKGSNYVVNGYKVALKPELKYQALKSFIGLSSDNLRSFCQKQITSNMEGVVANGQMDKGKFIPQVFVQRLGITDRFNDFLMTGKKVFGIIGESGYGKTNALCDLAIEYSKQNPVLFFNGSQIAGDLLDEILYEFSWDFGSQLSGIEIVQRMTETLVQFDKDLIIFIDAIDEFPNSDSKLFLNNFVKHCPTRVKLCITCKESVWSDFLSQAGIRSPISCQLFTLKQNDNFSFSVNLFSKTELDTAVKKYQQFFNLPSVEGSTKAICRNL